MSDVSDIHYTGLQKQSCKHSLQGEAVLDNSSSLQVCYAAE